MNSFASTAKEIVQFESCYVQMQSIIPVTSTFHPPYQKTAVAQTTILGRFENFNNLGCVKNKTDQEKAPVSSRRGNTQMLLLPAPNKFF